MVSAAEVRVEEEKGSIIVGKSTYRWILFVLVKLLHF